MSDYIKGIDISTIQGSVDFASLINIGISFVICRCGVGNGGKDPLYDQNISRAKAAGLKVMCYHFIYPLPPLASQPLRDPVKQAQLHASWANGELACCDLEWPATQDWSKWGCTAEQIVSWTITYLEAYEAATGIRPVVYTYPYFANALNLPPEFGQKYKLWIASYTNPPTVPAPWTDWALCQNSGGTWKLPNGVPCDTDIAKDLSIWDGQLNVPNIFGPPAEPPPMPTPLPIPDISPVVPVIPQPVQPSTWQNILNTLSGLFGR